MNTLANLDKKNVRYNVLIIIVYLIGIILLLQLFNLQIVHGEEYSLQSNSRLTRETKIEAARGNIKDRNGNIIAGTVNQYRLEIYRSKVDKATLNNTILNVINILEKNDDKYRDSFPIKIEKEKSVFTIENEESLKNWKTSNGMREELSAEQVLNNYKEKYEISYNDIKDIRKVIAVRYGIEKEGYTSMRAYIISNSINTKSVAEIEEKGRSFSGIAINSFARRTYTNGSLASHILGYIGAISGDELSNNPDYGMNDYIGKTGIEYIFEKFLRGENGVRQTDMSVNGTTTGEYITKEAIAGDDVVLSIDANLQSVAEKALKNNIEKIKSGGFGESYDVKCGSVVVLNVKTGEILAMCSYPDYEPELFIDGVPQDKWAEYNEEDKKALINRSIQSAYAPGSIFKMVTATAGLETKAVTLTETVNDTGIYPKAHRPRCWIYTNYGYPHGRLNVSGAIKNSCNYFFYEMGDRLGIDKIEEYAGYYGLGEKTGVELPSETSGTLAGKKLYEKLGETWQYGSTLSAAIGQAENSFSPLQIAKYIGILVNGGKDLDVTLIKDIINSDDKSINKEEIDSYVNEKLGLAPYKAEDLNFKKENIDAILEGMKSVTTETGGTAYSVFRDFSVEVGGKTGSAEAANSTVNAWFAGFAPYNDPEIAIVVTVENGWHGYYTAEVAKEILAMYFGVIEEIEEDRVAIPDVSE